MAVESATDGQFDSLGWASLAASVAGGLGGGGGMSSADIRKQSAMQYRHARTYGPEITQLNAQAAMTGKYRAATDLGLHPLFAMGIGGGGGGSPGFNMPGQSPSGNHADVGAAIATLGERKRSLQRDARSASMLKSDLLDAKLRRTLTQLQIDKIKNTAGQGPNPHDLTEFADKRNVSQAKKGLVEIVPVQINASTDGGTTSAGIIPGWNNFKLADTLTIRAPLTETDSLWESPGAWIPILADPQNRKAIKAYIEKVTGYKVPQLGMNNPHGKIVKYVFQIMKKLHGVKPSKSSGPKPRSKFIYKPNPRGRRQ